MSSKFIDRNEVSVIKERFKSALEKHNGIAILLSGPAGVGKTKIAEQAIKESLEDEVLHVQHLRGFKPERDCIRVDCSENRADQSDEAFIAFRPVKEFYAKRQKGLRILKNGVSVVLAFFGINDVLETMRQFARELPRGGEASSPNPPRQKELFYYASAIRQMSKRHPKILLIKSVQHIDTQSLRLIRILVSVPGLFRGMILMEKDDNDLGDDSVDGAIKGLLHERRVFHVRVRPLDLPDLRELIRAELDAHHPPVNLPFDADQLDRIYKVTHGLPGALKQALTKWKDEGWLIEENGVWKVRSNFTMSCLLTPTEILLNDVRASLADDGDINERELAGLKNLQAHLKLSDEEVDELIALGRYELKSGVKIHYRIRSGGLGNVYRAEAEGKEMMVEVLRGRAPHMEDVLALREAPPTNILIPMALVHGDYAIITTDFISGRTVRELLTDEGELTLDRALVIAKEAACGLEVAWKSGVIHGFLRPESVLVCDDHSVKVCGFGYATSDWVESYVKQHRHNVTAFLAPEVIAGESATQRSDVYSLGVILLEMLIGGTLAEAHAKKSELSPSTLLGDRMTSRLPTSVRAILNRALEREPMRRYDNYGDLIRDLEKALLEDQEVERGKLPLEVPEIISQPNWFRIGVACSMLILLGIGIVYFLKVRSASDTIPRAVMIEPFAYEKSDLLPGMLEYLLERHLVAECQGRSPEEPKVFSGEADLASFHRLSVSSHDHQRSRVPQFQIEGSVITEANSVSLNLAITDRETHHRAERTFDFNGKAYMLSNGVDEVIGFVLTSLQLPTKWVDTHLKTTQMFTQSWDAFKHYYEGERAWSRLSLDVARREFSKAVDFDPGFGLAFLRRAQVSAFLSDFSAARPDLQTAKQLKASLIALDTLRMHALIASADGRLPSQVDALRRIQEIIRWRAQSYYDLGEAYYSFMELPSAIENYKESLRLDSTFALAYNHLGYSLVFIGDYEGGLQALRKYLEMDPSANAYDSYGDGLMYAGRYDEAIAAKEKGISLDTNLYYLYGSMGDIYRHKGEYSKALSRIERMNGKAPTATQKALALSRLALVEHLQGNQDRAEELCGAARAMLAQSPAGGKNPEIEWLYGLLAWHKKDGGKLKSTLAWMDSVIESQGISTLNFRQILKCKLDLAVRFGMLQSDTQAVSNGLRDLRGLESKLRRWSSLCEYSMLLCDVAGWYAQRGLPAQAETVIQRAMEFNPYDAIIIFTKGNLLWSQGHKRNAAEMYKKFLNIWKDADKALREVRIAESRITESSE
jgi:serine/threonine protein kinase/tetratricopeptide (TPR) repeat protein